MRRHLERQTRSYLKDGGEIRAVPQGVSAVDEAVSAIHTPIFTRKRVRLDTRHLIRSVFAD